MIGRLAVYGVADSFEHKVTYFPVLDGSPPRFSDS